MSSSEVSLLQMPKVPMKHILEYLEFPSILILRKVCHDLRNFIDDTKPASHLTNVWITCSLEFIKLSLESRAQKNIRIFYEKCNEGCLVKKYRENAETKRTILDNENLITAFFKDLDRVLRHQKTVLEEKDNEDSEEKATTLNDEDFITVFCKDFDIILRHQKTILEYFGTFFNSSNSTVKERVLESVSKAFKSMNPPLQVKSLDMGVNCHNEILSILPYIDPKPLELIQISEASNRENHVLNLNEIGQLEQWKQAKKLRIREFQLPDLVQNIKHLSNIDLGYRQGSMEELILLKEIFLSSSTLTTVEINTRIHCPAVIGPIEGLGEPLVDTNQNRNWFFRIPGTIQFLRITYKSFKILFNRIEQSDVPRNVIILN